MRCDKDDRKGTVETDAMAIGRIPSVVTPMHPWGEGELRQTSSPQMHTGGVVPQP